MKLLEIPECETMKSSVYFIAKVVECSELEIKKPDTRRENPGVVP